MRCGSALAVFILAASLAHAQAGPPRSPADAFLARHAGEPGVRTLAGVQYRVIHSGPAGGRHPTRADDVTVRYTARLLSGQVVDATDPGQTRTFELKQLISGWVTALQLMRPGDEWEVWVPPEMGYGSQDKGPIPGGSVLDFTVELVSVAPHAQP